MVRNPEKLSSSGKSPTRSARGVETALIKLGKNIRRLRRNAKLTQEQVTEKANLSVTHWSDLERGMSNPTFTTLFAVAKALKVKIEDLVS